MKYLLFVLMMCPFLANAGEFRLGADLGQSTATYTNHNHDDYYDYNYDTTDSYSKSAFDIKAIYSQDWAGGYWNTDIDAGYSYVGVNQTQSSFVADIDAKYYINEHNLIGPALKLLANDGTNLLLGLKYQYSFDAPSLPRLELSYYSDFDDPNLSIFMIGASFKVF